MFFTRKGDDGSTGWLGEGRLPKYDLRIEALGSIDECTASLGLARSMMGDSPESALVLQIQRDLYQVMAEVAASPENAEKFRKIGPGSVTDLENQIQGIQSRIQMPDEFIVSGDSQASAAIALSRTSVRRAERRVMELLDRGMVINPNLGVYLNRLSSLLFVLEIFLLQQSGKSHPTLTKGSAK
ncbi:MAG: cob(I)yrinic acid a,c-diamide adenosyltransferase [Bellilinea sp.]